MQLFATILKVVFISVSVHSSIQNLSSVGMYDTKISQAYIKDGALLATNVVVHMPEDEHQKMNNL